MRKIIFAMLLLCSSTLIFAGDAITPKYSMSYFGKEYNIIVSRLKAGGKASLQIYMQADPEVEGDVAYLFLWNKNINPLRMALTECKTAFLNMKAEAEASGKKDFSQDIVIKKFPKLPLHYYCVEHNMEHFSLGGDKVTPKFVVFEDGTCNFVLTATIGVMKESGYTVYSAKRDFFIVFQSAEEFDALINELDPTR